MLAGPVFVTMATRAKVESERGREPSRDRASLRPNWSEIGGGGVGCWVGNDVTCSPVSRWEGSSPKAPAGSKHRHNGRVFKVGLSRYSGRVLHWFKVFRLPLSSFVTLFPLLPRMRCNTATLHTWHTSWQTNASVWPLTSLSMSHL